VGTALACLLIIATVLAVAGGLLYSALKGCRNIMIIANNTSKDIIANMEHIENGERTGVTTRIPAANKKLDEYWAGLHIYDKNNVGGYSAGFFGSTFGISFDSDLGHFSVGMDCPNMRLGGKNSIAVTDQEHAYNAMCKARDDDNTNVECQTHNRQISGYVTSFKRNSIVNFFFESS
jgi:hypothetical protein